MTFNQNEWQKDLKKNIEKFCKEKIEPFLEQDDESGHFRQEIYQGLGHLGLTGMLIPEEFGGAGLLFQDYVFVLRHLARCSVSYAVTLSVSTMVQSLFNNYGTSIQKNRYLPLLTSGSIIGAFALTESSSGSDASALQMKATKVAGGYELNGSKMFITSAGIAGVYVVFARTGQEGPKGISAFVVDSDFKGLSFGKCEKKMGWKISPTRELIFQNCFVPEQNILGKEGEGFSMAMSGLSRGRIAIGAISVGLSERAFEESSTYSLERKQFEQSLFDFQGIQFMLADMYTEIEASRLLVEEAANKEDQNILDPKWACMCKIKASDTAMKVTTDAVQILGGVGYTQEFRVERYMRDAKALQIVEGTNQIQRLVLARQLKKERS